MIGRTFGVRAALLSLALTGGYASHAGAATPTTLPGFKLSVFAAPKDVSAPDSVIAVGNHVWIAYGNNVPPDGSSGSSNIVEYTLDGSVVRNLTVEGHNDGMRFDPASRLLWVLENEDADPLLVVVDPENGSRKKTIHLRAVNGGGYDDAAFIGDRVYISASNPALTAGGINVHPALITLTPSAGGLVPETVLSGNSYAIDAVTHEAVKLNLTDPDSLTVMPNGNLLLDDQGDAQLIELQFHAGSAPFIAQIPLIGGVQVDDTVFATKAAGTLFISDTPANTVYALSSDRFQIGQPYTASTGVPATASTPAIPAFVGRLYLDSGATVPVVSGLSAPHGMAFLAR